MITVNDEERPEVEGYTVRELLGEMDPKMPMAVVRINGSHVQRVDWKKRKIRDGDEVRVIYIIAGG